MATPVMEKFAVKFQIYTKVIKVDVLAFVYDKTKHVFSFLKMFPENFIIKYEDKDLDYVDFDSPKSNILMVESQLVGEIVNFSMPNDYITLVQIAVFQGISCVHSV